MRNRGGIDKNSFYPWFWDRKAAFCLERLGNRVIEPEVFNYPVSMYFRSFIGYWEFEGGISYLI
jgi:hypothetical protein